MLLSAVPLLSLLLLLGLRVRCRCRFRCPFSRPPLANRESYVVRGRKRASLGREAAVGRFAFRACFCLSCFACPSPHAPTGARLVLHVLGVARVEACLPGACRGGKGSTCTWWPSRAATEVEAESRALAVVCLVSVRALGVLDAFLPRSAERLLVPGWQGMRNAAERNRVNPCLCLFFLTLRGDSPGEYHAYTPYAACLEYIPAAGRAARVASHHSILLLLRASIAVLLCRANIIRAGRTTVTPVPGLFRSSVVLTPASVSVMPQNGHRSGGSPVPASSAPASSGKEAGVVVGTSSGSGNGDGDGDGGDGMDTSA